MLRISQSMDVFQDYIVIACALQNPNNSKIAENDFLSFIL